MSLAPYGEQVSQTGAYTDLKFGFTDKMLDDESGLNYFGARYFLPGIGRWGSADPLFVNTVKSGSTEAIALWSYVRNNPVKLTDSTGMVSDEALGLKADIQDSSIASTGTAGSDAKSGTAGQSSNAETYSAIQGTDKSGEARSANPAEVRPVEGGVISSRFNESRVHPTTHVPQPHRGEDIAVPAGTSVHSTQYGIVIQTGKASSGEGRVEILHSDCSAGGLMETLSRSEQDVEPAVVWV